MSEQPTIPEQSAPDSRRAGFVLGMDVGSSVIRCHVYDRAARICGSSAQKVESLYPQAGWVEIDPDILWLQFVAVIKESVKAAGIEMKQIVGLGISTQRATFITWDKKTGKHFHNFISWQDLRAIELVKSWNNSLLMKLIHSSCRILHFFTRSKQFLAASLFTFTTQHVSLRLAWILQNLTEVRKAVEEENCCFGTVDTWLLHKLTKGSEFATDFSNASTTGLFDPYEMCWSKIITSLLSIPLSLLPPVKDTSHNFGSVDEEIFGVPIPIVALVADQQSAMFGECCFQTGDVKLTMGTGTFLDINTGNKPQQSVGGFYPLIGWKIGQEVVCLAEGNAGDTGTAIAWAQQLDLFTDAAETEKMAKSLEDSEGVYFVPSFSGLQDLSCPARVEPVPPALDHQGNPRSCVLIWHEFHKREEQILLASAQNSISVETKSWQVYYRILRKTHGYFIMTKNSHFSVRENRSVNWHSLLR
ncbi:putative glycerol kinase 5 isoform X2 [Cervus canadensis]|uniref:putative glycerol kinase 5 isoform X2 n=1 Tax=Cervus canadensis TaxID=1574408 RepID=UPI001C9E37AD|nr:putative glycerol kinase 5 isoform X2 [Cervus canadensis]